MQQGTKKNKKKKKEDNKGEQGKAIMGSPASVTKMRQVR
jgi:hypothetical protein